MPRQTAFQKFLVKERACGAAREFVEKHGGSFERAWKANKSEPWREWLFSRLGPEHGGEIEDCPGCAHDASCASPRKRSSFVLASARKRRWIK